MSSYQHMLTPIQLGTKMCRNRVVMAAHSYGYADKQGLPTNNLVNYLVERAKGGVGMAIMGATSVSPDGGFPAGDTTRNLNDDIIPWYDEIARQMHSHGALVFDQLVHTGGQLRGREGARILAPSPVPHERTRGIPRELTSTEIASIVSDFANAAQRALRGGLDGIELKCDQGFLVHQFLSPYFNRRNDQYGGTYNNRLRFLFETLERIRKVVGSDLVIGLRVSADAMQPGCLTFRDALRICKDVDATGQVDYFHINAGTNSTFYGYYTSHGDSSISDRNFLRYAKEIKQAVQSPVIASSRITHPDEIEDIIASGDADMVALARALISDAEFVVKAQEDRVEDIRYCILCNQGCIGNHHLGGPVRCIQNPATGHESELGIGTIIKAKPTKVVAIVGAGPAGLETARVAAMRGHEVHLFEKAPNIGGQLLLAGRMPYRQGFLDTVHFLERQVRNLGVHIYTKTTIEAKDVVSMTHDIDQWVIATGSHLLIPPVYSDIDPGCALTIQDMVEQEESLGKNTIVFDIDWRHNALAVTEWLIQREHHVTLITSAFSVAEGLNIATRTSHFSRIYLHPNVVLLPLTDLISLRDKTARLRNVLNEKISEISPIDQIVFVSGSVPYSSLYTEVQQISPHVVSVGDCLEPLGIPDAMLTANRVARTF